MTLLDVSHTCHTRSATGIQRVVRMLAHHLPEAATGGCRPLTWDPYAARWRDLRTYERHRVFGEERSGSSRRSPQWPIWAKGAGCLQRWLAPRPVPEGVSGRQAILFPEVFSRTVFEAVDRFAEVVHGPRVAVFHDAIALSHPETCAPATVARFPGYMRELAAFDGVIAVSGWAADRLLAYWDWCGVAAPPPVQAIPLGCDPRPSVPPPPPAEGRNGPILLAVGTFEARKNQAALLTAAESLWEQGERFELVFVGAVQRQTGMPAWRQALEMQRDGRPVSCLGSVSRPDLESWYARCAATVYPSLVEGFGLPVLESLRLGRPCLCGRGGALAETARGGGCAQAESDQPEGWAKLLQRFLREKDFRAELVDQAAHRPLRTWAGFAHACSNWIEGLSHDRQRWRMNRGPLRLTGCMVPQTSPQADQIGRS